MIVTYNWLREYVDFSITIKELAEKLTSMGPEVALIKPLGITKENKELILFSKVKSIKPHPKQDTLKIVNVSFIGGSAIVITNSPNVEKGDHVVYAKPGAKIGGIEVSEKEIKGIKSEGMLIAKEHLNLEEKSHDIWIMDGNEKEAKEEFDVYVAEDYSIEVELTANRSDCLSIIGIAREVAAMLDLELKVNKPEINEDLEESPDITVENKNLCPRYTSRILKNIEVKNSPAWIRRKLEVCGIRAINNIVDATNYVQLEYGHPTHSFDLNRLAGEKIVVKTAEDGEVFTTLDSKEHELTDEMLVICDGERSVALAGIMGGENSEIFEGTANVLLESAYFDPISIRTTSKQLDIKTESSYRFERTADWGITKTVLDRLTELICLTTNPKVSHTTDAYASYFKDTIINIKAGYISQKLESRSEPERERD